MLIDAFATFLLKTISAIGINVPRFYFLLYLSLINSIYYYSIVTSLDNYPAINKTPILLLIIIREQTDNLVFIMVN